MEFGVWRVLYRVVPDGSKFIPSVLSFRMFDNFEFEMYFDDDYFVKGGFLKIVQERLGHSTIAITLDTYSHVAPGLQEAAAKRFDDLIINKHSEIISSKSE